MIRLRPALLTIITATAALAAGCDGNTPLSAGSEALDIDCSIPVSDIHRGAFRGSIPALTNPNTAFWGGEETAYLRPEDRVAGIVLNDQPIAIPLNIFWWHEIVNIDTEDRQVAVTHCPLTGSTLAFDRAPAGGAEFDVSGLLYENNLIMFDRSGDAESLWPQMARGARCGPKDGTSLPMVFVVEMTWDGWRDLHPDSRIVTSETGYIRDYAEYPYGDYDDADNANTLFPLSTGIDPRRPPKERAIGVPDGERSTVFPYGELTASGWTAAIHGSRSKGDYVVLWDRTVEGAAVFRPEIDGQALSFRAERGRIFDDQTGSQWTVDGLATAGPLAGSALEPVSEAFVAFWFAWPAFYHPVEVWTAS